MKITPVITSKVLPLNPNNYEKNNVNINPEKNITNFPSSYGLTNIAFCGRNTKISRKKENVEIIQKDLPIFSPYNDVIVNTMKNLASKGFCMISYNDYIDSQEIFLKNLRSFIDTNRLEQLGFPRNIPFLDINLDDYTEDYSNAVFEINKHLNKHLKPSQKAILTVNGVRDLFNRMDCPDEFSRSSVFKKYPTIFFVEEGFEGMNMAEIGIINEGMKNPYGNPDKPGFFRPDFLKLRSKYTFLNHTFSDRLEFPPVQAEYLLKYLADEDVQKKLITNGTKIEVEPEAIAFAINIAKALDYYKTELQNHKNDTRLLDESTSAINSTINLLKNAVALKLILNPEAKVCSIADIISSIPSTTNWFEKYKNFVEIQKDIIKEKLRLIEEAKAKLENPESAQNSEEITDSDETDESKKEKSKADDVISKGNYEITNNPKTKFSDIGGMYNIKKQLKEEFIDILKNPLVKNSQKPSGILLSGPPGCGKTLLARAIAGEAQVPFISTAGSSFVEIYVGTGAKRVRELYAAAREEAKKHPLKTAIVFIDEVDAVAGSRKNNGSSEDLRTINALLHEMDGSNNKDEKDIKIITIVATNNENMLDSAFKRSGRIDLKYTIDDPRYSVKAREEIIKIHSKDLNFHSDEEKQKMLHNLAVSSAGMSGADLAELLKKANRMSMNVNRTNNYVTSKDINEAKMQILAGIKTDIEHTDYELKQTIAHEAGHAVTSMVLEKIFENEKNKHKMPSKVLDFITNSARGSALGATYFKPSEHNKMSSKETCLTNIIELYGGYAIESEMFDTHSAGVSQDLDSATSIIENAVSKYDFGSEKHYLSLNSDITKSLFAAEIKEDMLAFSKKGMDISKQIIQFAQPFIEFYVNELISSSNIDQTVTADEFKSKFNSWLTENSKKSAYLKLCKNIKTQIDNFCSEKSPTKTKIGF